jgi:hypothetical protein
MALRTMLLPLLLLLAGCTSSTDLTLTAPLDIDGVYASTAEVGALGEVELTLRKRVNSTRGFNATLHSANAAIEDSSGRGTLGNLHLILNFEIGQTDDYYFQGDIVLDGGGAVTGITGTFIFPGQPEQLPVEFTRTGDAPPLEEE